MRVFRRTPGELRRLVRGLTGKELRTRPSKTGWSIAHLVTHLCDAENVMSFRIRKAIAESNSPISPYDQNKWAARLHYDQTDVGRSLRLFTALRESHVALLGVLSRSELRRYGIHAERGKETVERMIHLLAGHDVNHLLQVKSLRDKLLKKRA